MSNHKHERAVWLTREQRDAIEESCAFYGHRNAPAPGPKLWVQAAVVAAWDAAPADLVEAVTDAIYDNDGWEAQVAAVLRALGNPA